MKLETAAAAAKVLATGGASAGLFGLTPWGWAAALIGASLSYYFEPEQTPDKAVKIAFGVLAMAFFAGMAAVLMPHVPWFGIGDAASKAPPEALAGVLGLSIRFIWEQGRRLGAAKKPTAGS